MCKKLIYLFCFVLVLALAGTNVVFGGNVIERRISAGSDDGEEAVNTGFQDSYNTSSDLEMLDDHSDNGGRQFIGMNFRDIGIAPGEKISSAYIEFVCEDLKDGTGDAYLLIWGHLTPNPDGFATPFVISNRPKTVDKVSWDPEPWTALGQVSQTADISSIIQELIDQSGWAAGNAIEIIVGEDTSKPAFTGSRCAHSFNGSPSNAPLLHIEIAVPYATKPNPVDGALLEDTWVLLGWSPGMFAVSHDVFLGDNFDNVNDGTGDTFQGNQTSTFLIVGFPGFPFPDGLVPDTTYYWRIDGVEADGTTKHTGDVWSFMVPSKKAYNPNPADGGKYVDPDVELSWTAGPGAKLHYVHFGDNFNDVNNATGGIPQGIKTYTPGPLELDKTYYWRVDEFDGFVTNKGDVWSFETLPIIAITNPNLIGWWKFDIGSGITAIDWSGYGNDGNLGGNPQWVEGVIGGALELRGGDYVSIDGVVNDITSNDITLSAWIKTTQTREGNVFASNDSGGGHVLLFGIDNGNIYVDDGPVADWLPAVNDDQWHMITFVMKGSRIYLYTDGVQVGTVTTVIDITTETRWSIGQEWDGSSPSDFYVGMVDDVRFYDVALTPDEIKEIMRGDPLVAWDPKPANGSTTDIERATPLSWSPGEQAAQHDVYFGTDELAVDGADASDATGIYRGRQTAASYTPSEALAWGTGPYYWRIDEYNTDATVATGKVWNFTVADYLIVDDIESYNDLDPSDPASNRIFLMWLDGYGVATNGSLVGYELPPFCERGIVHSGMQSMPFAYDNSGTARYSEATLTLTQRDWTKEGVGTLTVWFRGDSANTAAPMYITLNGSATVSHGDPDAALIGAWTEWNIPLTDFSNQGVVLTNVNSITIGFGNKTSPQPSGSGMMFFDDIRLYR